MLDILRSVVLAGLGNQVGTLVSVDFFTLPTVFFDVLQVFVVLAHHRRRIVYFNVTSSPSASWAAQQITNAFPWDAAPRYLLRGRDGIHGAKLRNRMKNMGIHVVLIAPRSPWQSPCVERVIGTSQRDLLDHLIVIGEEHLRRLLRKYIDEYYHPCRTSSARPVRWWTASGAPSWAWPIARRWSMRSL